MFAKILDAQGNAVCRVDVPGEADILLSVPEGGSWVSINSLECRTVALMQDNIAQRLVMRFDDELEGQATIEGMPFKIVKNGTTLEDLNGVNFAALRERKKAHIDEAAGFVRKAYLTDVPGQDYVYSAKYAEAVQLASDPDPKVENYPFLAAHGGDLAATAKSVLDGKAKADAAIAKIETARMAAKAALDAAPDDKSHIDGLARDAVSRLMVL